MGKIIINQDNLTMNDIDDSVTRVKCFVMNDKNKIMLGCTADGCYQLPGGHVDGDEDYKIAVKREILEEAGIELEDSEIVENFHEVHNLKKNYRNSGKNKLASVFYFFIKTNKKINLSKTNMTEHEKNVGYSIDFYSLQEMEERLLENYQNNPVEIYRSISRETLEALDEFKKYSAN